MQQQIGQTLSQPSMLSTSHLFAKHAVRHALYAPIPSNGKEGKVQGKIEMKWNERESHSCPRSPRANAHSPPVMTTRVCESHSTSQLPTKFTLMPRRTPTRRSPSSTISYSPHPPPSRLFSGKKKKKSVHCRRRCVSRTSFSNTIHQNGKTNSNI